MTRTIACRLFMCICNSAAIQAWEEAPLGLRRLEGKETDIEDSVLKVRPL